MTTGKGTLIGVRLLDEQLATLDAWIAAQEPDVIIPNLTRPEAIRRLLEIGLSHTTRSEKRATRSKELAAETIDTLLDPSTSTLEAVQRKRRLIKGPEEFREARVDMPKAKKR